MRRGRLAAATVLLAACGTGPDGLFLAAGGRYTFAASVQHSYDCDPGNPNLVEPRDDALCGPATGVIPVSSDTVRADITLDRYTPSRVCDMEGCRDDTSHGRFLGLATAQWIHCAGTDCSEGAAEQTDVEISHATTYCTGGMQPVWCVGYDGRTIVHVTIQFPGQPAFFRGVPQGREIRGYGIFIFTFSTEDRRSHQAEWVLR